MERETKTDTKVSGGKSDSDTKNSACCCRGNAPVLLKEDAKLFESGILTHSETYTIRENEPSRSTKDNCVYDSMELIRIKEKPDTGECLFYDAEKGCAIYETRPAQCRQSECRDSSKVLLDELESSRLTREDLFSEDDEIMEIMSHHEEKCSYKSIRDAVDMLSFGEETAVDELINILQYDTYSRPYIQENFSIEPEMLDLILGRPLVKTIEMFGIQALQDGEQYILSKIEEAV
ncbi:MAG: YkgJ family cysteine cluster protein [Dissulfurispiraceae bacterium]|nr:YkgJ family cysteine cluster protein [Dissulfurispiraceae bacterium]